MLQSRALVVTSTEELHDSTRKHILRCILNYKWLDPCWTLLDGEGGQKGERRRSKLTVFTFQNCSLEYINKRFKIIITWLKNALMRGNLNWWLNRNRTSAEFLNCFCIFKATLFPFSVNCVPKDHMLHKVMIHWLCHFEFRNYVRYHSLFQTDSDFRCCHAHRYWKLELSAWGQFIAFNSFIPVIHAWIRTCADLGGSLSSEDSIPVRHKLNFFGA